MRPCSVIILIVIFWILLFMGMHSNNIPTFISELGLCINSRPSKPTININPYSYMQALAMIKRLVYFKANKRSYNFLIRNKANSWKWCVAGRLIRKRCKCFKYFEGENCNEFKGPCTTLLCNLEDCGHSYEEALNRIECFCVFPEGYSENVRNNRMKIPHFNVGQNYYRQRKVNLEMPKLLTPRNRKTILNGESLNYLRKRDENKINSLKQDLENANKNYKEARNNLISDEFPYHKNQRNLIKNNKRFFIESKRENESLRIEDPENCGNLSLDKEGDFFNKICKFNHNNSKTGQLNRRLKKKTEEEVLPPLESKKIFELLEKKIEKEAISGKHASKHRNKKTHKRKNKKNKLSDTENDSSNDDFEQFADKYNALIEEIYQSTRADKSSKGLKSKLNKLNADTNDNNNNRRFSKKHKENSDSKGCLVWPQDIKEMFLGPTKSHESKECVSNSKVRYDHVVAKLVNQKEDDDDDNASIYVHESAKLTPSKHKSGKNGQQSKSTQSEKDIDYEEVKSLVDFENNAKEEDAEGDSPIAPLSQDVDTIEIAENESE